MKSTNHLSYHKADDKWRLLLPKNIGINFFSNKDFLLFDATLLPKQYKFLLIPFIKDIHTTLQTIDINDVDDVFIVRSKKVTLDTTRRINLTNGFAHECFLITSSKSSTHITLYGQDLVETLYTEWLYNNTIINII